MRNLSTGQFSVSRFGPEVGISYTVALILGIWMFVWQTYLLTRIIVLFQENQLASDNSCDYREEPRHPFCSSVGALRHSYSASCFHINEQICDFTAWFNYKWCQNAESSNLSYLLLNQVRSQKSFTTSESKRQLLLYRMIWTHVSG
jgi:hypothetical protein